MLPLINRLRRVYKKAPVIPFDSRSKLIIMSDCHRGQGNTADSFLQNQDVYFGALEYYFQNGFTYLELGDGDELWENRNMEAIVKTHSNVFWMLSQFYKEKRFHMLFGNHDIVKSKRAFSKKHCHHYFCDASARLRPLFPGIAISEGLILEHAERRQKIFLVHGHQGDFLNDTLWKLARFLVRYLWRPLELVGFTAPTGAGRARKKRDKIERNLAAYAASKNEILIAGHTHRPMFPSPGTGYYFNDGSCVHPRCITGIEIENDAIALVKWSVCTREDLSLYVGREVLEGPVELAAYHGAKQVKKQRMGKPG